MERDEQGSPRRTPSCAQVARTEGFSAGTGRPTPRELTGVALTCLSYVLGWPAVGVLGVLSIRLDEPLFLVIGTPSLLVLSHSLFAVGLYLAGGRRIAAWVRRTWRS